MSEYLTEFYLCGDYTRQHDFLAANVLNPRAAERWRLHSVIWADKGYLVIFERHK